MASVHECCDKIRIVGVRVGAPDLAQLHLRTNIPGVELPYECSSARLRLPACDQRQGVEVVGAPQQGNSCGP